MNFIDAVWESAHEQLTIAPARIPVVVAAAVLIYLSFLVLIKVFGSRVLTSLSASDAIIIFMFGSVAGRVIVGHPPTLAAGVIALTTLITLEAFFGSLRRHGGLGRVIDREPVLLISNGEVVDENVKSAHVSPSDIRSSIRRAGLGSYTDVQAMVLEASGHISVLRNGSQLDPELFNDVRGASRLRGE
ncbi:MAG: DUF421 domain-containing protein [Corynebacterium sp.]|nr:DUF421 domain-containing protein [Corynebacterium sp.]